MMAASLDTISLTDEQVAAFGGSRERPLTDRDSPKAAAAKAVVGDADGRGMYVANGKVVRSKVETYAERAEREMMEKVAALSMVAVEDAKKSVQERIKDKLNRRKESAETAELKAVLTSSGDAAAVPKKGDVREAYYCNDMGCWVAQQVYCDETGCWLDDKSANPADMPIGAQVGLLGIFAPAVLGAKQLMGEQNLKEFRASVIAKHSKVISNFVDTS